MLLLSDEGHTPHPAVCMLRFSHADTISRLRGRLRAVNTPLHNPSPKLEAKEPTDQLAPHEDGETTHTRGIIFMASPYLVLTSYPKGVEADKLPSPSPPREHHRSGEQGGMGPESDAAPS